MCGEREDEKPGQEASSVTVFKNSPLGVVGFLILSDFLCGELIKENRQKVFHNRISILLSWPFTSIGANLIPANALRARPHLRGSHVTMLELLTNDNSRSALSRSRDPFSCHFGPEKSVIGDPYTLMRV